MLCKTPPAVTRWAVFFMPIGYLCQWISYAVFAVVFVCCVVTIQNHPYSKMKSGWPEIAFLIAS